MSRSTAIGAFAGALIFTAVAATSAHAAADTPIRWAMLAHAGDCVEISDLREFERMRGVAMTLEQVRSRIGASSVQPVQIRSFERAYLLPLSNPRDGAVLVVPLSDCPKQD